MEMGLTQNTNLEADLKCWYSFSIELGELYLYKRRKQDRNMRHSITNKLPSILVTPHTLLWPVSILGIRNNNTNMATVKATFGKE